MLYCIVMRVVVTGASSCWHPLASRGTKQTPMSIFGDDSPAADRWCKQKKPLFPGYATLRTRRIPDLMPLATSSGRTRIRSANPGPAQALLSSAFNSSHAGAEILTVMVPPGLPIMSSSTTMAGSVVADCCKPNRVKRARKKNQIYREIKSQKCESR